MPAVKVPFTITYRSPGTQPPVFLAGSFTDPEWLAQEMQCSVDDDGERVFKTQFELEPGRECQFKFKVGNDGSWVLDASKPVVTDELGNRTNLLKVPLEHPSDGHDAHNPRPPSLLKTSLATIKDAEADRKSSTPIEQVAATAAEVADTAEKLDAEESSPPPQVSGSGGESEAEDDLRTPLFAHECFGAYEFVDDGLDHDSCVDHSQIRGSNPKSKDFGIGEVDLNDPTLERFPSDKPSVLDTLRKIRSSMSEDRVSFDDLRYSDSRRTSVDSDDSVFSAVSLSPVTNKRREHRLSTSSGRNRSLASLGSIAEEPKPGVAAGGSIQPSASTSQAKKDPHLNRAKSPTIDEDETLMMRTSRG